MADYFAIPKQDEKGETIDWYSAFDGNVVPWSAAMPEEKRLVKIRLLDAQKKLRAKSISLQSADDSEQQVFGKLLELATRIPSDDHVYLIDGRPVITFWGFSERDGASDSDVLAGLDTGETVDMEENQPSKPLVEDTIPREDIKPSEVPRTRWFSTRWFSWPWILLLLLLLALLLFGIRACLQAGMPEIDLAWPVSVDKPTDSGMVVEEHSEEGVQSKKEEEQGNNSNASDEKESDVNSSSVVERSRQSSLSVERATRGSRDSNIDVQDSHADAAVEGDTKDTVDRTQTTDGVNDNSGAIDPAHEAKTTEYNSGLPKIDNESGSDTGLDDAENGDASSPNTDDSGKNPAQAQKGSIDQNEISDDAKEEAKNVGMSGQPLVIPHDAAKKGSTDFMNGKWRSATGLQDGAGNPIQLEYDFKGGNGTATLHRSVNGKEQTCTASVHPTFKGSKLVIDQAEKIHCPDGTAFDSSSVECSTNSQGRAECKGKNRDGSEYQVKINKK